MTDRIAPANRLGRYFSNRLLVTVIAAYLTVATICLIQTRGLPYGLDNNESFSSAVHARNLARYGLGRSFGLTDESIGATPAAHPVVHTHQGNFPRLFTLALYAVGARSIEAQIILTTLTIGLLAIILAFRFFSEAVNRVFAAIACLIFLSDYFLYGQWQFNTYRVWHAFFFFSSLACARRLLQQPAGRWAALSILNFACLCYWEYAFAVYVLTLVVIYAGLTAWRRPGRVAWVIGCVGMGGGLAAALLLLQLCAYMGWSNVLTDIQYTFHARNSSADSAFSAKVAGFYAEHRIEFWPNYMDASKLRNPKAFLDSVLRGQLQYYSPWLATIMILVGFCWLPLVVCSLRRGEVLTPTGMRQGRWLQVAWAVPVLLAGLWLTGRQSAWYDWSAAEIWLSAGWTRATGVTIIIALVVCIGVALLVFPIDRITRPKLVREIGGLWPLLLAGAVGYLVAYRIFTGYIFSGYLNRQAPFLVFLTDPLLALVFYTLALPLWGAAAGDERGRTSLNPWARRGLAAVAGALFLLIAGDWIRLQAVYLRIIPLDHYQFIKKLAAAPYRKSTFVVNTYAIPVGYQTDTWAYFEPVFFIYDLHLTQHGFQIARDPMYKWLADIGTNPAYAKPDYALIIDPTDWSDGVSDYLRSLGGASRAAIPGPGEGLLGRASNPFTAYLHNHLVETDDYNQARHFAIIKLDWDYPAYLLPLPAKDSELASETERGRPPLTIIEIATQRSDRDVPHSYWLSIDAGGPRKAAWIGAAQRDQEWKAERSGRGEREALNAETADETWLRTAVPGEAISLNLRTGPSARKLWVRVNDYSGIVDLQSPTEGLRTLHFSAAETTLPSVPGQYVALHRTEKGIEVSYRYAQQEKLPEENTVIDLFQRDREGEWHNIRTIALLGRSGWPVDLFSFRAHNPDTLHSYAGLANTDDHRTYLQWLADLLATGTQERNRAGLLPAPESWITPARLGEAPVRHLRLNLQIASGTSLVALLRPGTRTKAGPGYLSNYLDADRASSPDLAAEGARTRYGSIKMELNFALHPANRSEPLVTTGVAMAGDFIYAVYPDAEHIQIGFDHWGVGGAVSPPILIDRRKSHEIAVSMGSLYPPDGSIQYRDRAPSLIDRLKGRIIVTIDGQTTLDLKAECYESPPSFVAIGSNPIGGSTTSDKFSGKILKISRDFAEH